MALRKDTPASSPAAAAPQFEEMDTATAVAEDTVIDNDTGEINPPAAAEAPASAPAQVPAVRKENPLSATVIKKDTTIAGLQDVIPPDDLAAMGIGVFPRITCSPGNFMRDKTAVLGDEVRFALASWSFVWIVSTKEQNNPEANKKVRTSYDGVNLKDGEGTIADYIKQLKAEGYVDAQSNRYIELYGTLLYTSKLKDIPVEQQELVQVSLSPQSVAQWHKFQLESAMRNARGVKDGNIIVMTADSKTLGANTFGIAKFAPFKG